MSVPKRPNHELWCRACRKPLTSRKTAKTGMCRRCGKRNDPAVERGRCESAIPPASEIKGSS